jgi:hypothetical protein
MVVRNETVALSRTTGAERAPSRFTARTVESCQGAHQLFWCKRRRIHERRLGLSIATPEPTSPSWSTFQCPLPKSLVLLILRFLLSFGAERLGGDRLHNTFTSFNVC